MRIAVIGGGAAGLGAAGAAKGVDPGAEVVVYTADTDVAYSPCGIPYVHGREIESFERLFLATKEQYVKTGIDVHYETTVEAIDRKSRTVSVAGEGEASYDRLVIAAGWNYAKVGVPGDDLDGIYEVKYIRQAMEWDKRLDSCKSALIVEAGLVPMEMVGALVHRGHQMHRRRSGAVADGPTSSTPTSSSRSARAGRTSASTCSGATGSRRSRATVP